MAIQVSSIAELEEKMRSIIGNAMIKTEDDMVMIIGDRIDKEVYQAYTPNTYNRTGDLKSSLDTGFYEVSPQRIRSYIHHDPYYANWRSVKYGTKFSSVPEIVSYGKYGTFNGVGYDGQKHKLNPSGTEWGKPRYYMYMTDREYMDALSWHLPSYCIVHY